MKLSAGMMFISSFIIIYFWSGTSAISYFYNGTVVRLHPTKDPGMKYSSAHVVVPLCLLLFECSVSFVSLVGLTDFF